MCALDVRGEKGDDVYDVKNEMEYRFGCIILYRFLFHGKRNEIRC